MMREFVYWIQSKDESTRRGFVAMSTSISFLAIFLAWLAFNPFAGFRTESSPAPEVAGEQTDRTVSHSPQQTASPHPSQKNAPILKQATPTPAPDQLPLDLSGLSTPRPSNPQSEIIQSTPDIAPSNPLFVPQDNVSSTPEL